MQKDSYYFPHFCNARHDRKIKRIQKDLGLEGYGIFFMLLEVLREQTDFCYPYQDIDLLADEFGTSTAKIEVVVKNYDLFSINEQNNFFSPKLIFYLEPYLAMKEQRRLAGIKSGEKRRKKAQLKLNDCSTSVQQSLNGCTTDAERMLNENEQSKVKESKVNEIKESKINESRSSNEKELTTTANEIINPFSIYQKNIGLITHHIAERMNSLTEDGITQELLCRYIEVATERNKRTWAYIEKMAQGNLENNIKTIEQYEAYCIERANSFNKTEKGFDIKSKVVQHNFDQREYSDSDYDQFISNKN